MTRAAVSWPATWSDLTRRFRRARAASTPGRHPSGWYSKPMTLLAFAPYGLATLQRALCHRYDLVPPNSRWADKECAQSLLQRADELVR
jgi:hypothetical protein